MDGEFFSRKTQSTKVIPSLYVGLFSLNHKNGKGFIEYSNKSRYFGDFVNDKPHGQGMLEYGNEYYIGDF